MRRHVLERTLDAGLKNHRAPSNLQLQITTAKVTPSYDTPNSPPGLAADATLMYGSCVRRSSPGAGSASAAPAPKRAVFSRPKTTDQIPTMDDEDAGKKPDPRVSMQTGGACSISTRR